MESTPPPPLPFPQQKKINKATIIFGWWGGGGGGVGIINIYDRHYIFEDLMKTRVMGWWLSYDVDYELL